MTGKVIDNVITLELSELEASTIIAALEMSGHVVAEKLATRYSDRNTIALSLVSNIIKKIHTADHNEKIAYIPDALESE
ncbi:hypothetical protein F9L33_05445 [Amylibacter sp. SFDW26]|uniref:hypothetical protein n=1 Tax=Amylibacter sp. SFDW26 TaxID=2652722 RepID=UPI00126210AF|nr:hypothetical protein [Amylibacter sp. SFDW26]KAB7616196.1 hypothetical protein F9L33_05445 [Amylibacter sp. SFDW26]